MVIGNCESVFCFDCLIWNNESQQSASALVLSDVPSLTALNNRLKDEGLGSWKIGNWKLIEKPDSLQAAITA